MGDEGEKFNGKVFCYNPHNCCDNSSIAFFSANSFYQMDRQNFWNQK